MNLSRLYMTLTLSKYAGKAFLPFVYWWHRKRVFIPAIDDEILLMSVVDLAEGIREQKITSIRVVKAYIDRILIVDPLLKAVMDSRFTEALDEAIKADDLCQTLDKQTLKERYPLLGVPFTVKEMIGVEGLSQTIGVFSRQGVKCEKEGLTIRNLRNAGAIILCVTNVPEWCLSWETQNVIIGKTLNPYNTTYSPGGSSGGEAALLGSGASVFGIGSDFIGSCRLPAMFCGVFGHRPTRPLVSMEGPILLFTDKVVNDILTLGPMTRYAQDLPILLEVMIGPENTKLLNMREDIQIQNLTVYHFTKFSNSIIDVEFDPEILYSLSAVQSELFKEGANVKPANISCHRLFETLFSTVMAVDKSTMIEKTEISNEPGSLVKEYIKWIFCRSNHTLFAIHSQVLLRNNRFFSDKKKKICQKRLEILRNEIENILGPNSVLILPTFPTAAYRHFSSSTTIAALQFVLLPSVLNLPATTVPLGLNSKGLPIGIQVIAGKFQDKLCFAVAKFLEKKFGGWQPPPCQKKKQSCFN